ncbi:nitrate- and nitrite sensing domain-containing protein [Streptomyces sp. NPDC014983]|uniref:sensor histidine kinase n=1 Tax=Streptomyces sp. NPDC014983 TaxID=3364933 RepID=UPI0036F6A9C3
MQKKRPRRTGRQTAPEKAVPETPVGSGRPTHVRTRLIVAVAVVAAAVAGAGVPSLLTASSDVSDSQELVTLAARTQDALALANSLADERDEVTSYIAAGRPESKAPSKDRSTRVDRQAEDLRADSGTPADLRGDLDRIATVRRAALTGKSTALQAHQAYSATITELHRVAEQLAEQMPPRAGSGAYALAELDSAVQQSAAARGLLLAALDVPATTQTVINPVTGLPTTTSVPTEAGRKQRDALTAAAQQARLRSDAALADFRETAPKAAVDAFDSTVTGADVNSAEKYLDTFTAQPTFPDGAPAVSAAKLDAALSGRIDLMRGAESALYEHRTQALEKLRDDDVTALEIRVAVLGALMLVAVGLATAMARTLTRPLSVLRRGTARLAEPGDAATREPIAFTGRNDEFAQVVRSVNALHAHAVALHERVATLETDRKHLVGQRQKMADAREELRAELAEASAALGRVRASIGGTFVNLALRTLGLVERQLAVIEGLEDREQDPERLSTLFKLDHFATVMRRHSENLLVLAGTEHVQQHHGPVPLVDVVRAAVSEIERYEQVRIAALPPHAHIAGFAADDLSHLLAELMENATTFSPPEVPAEVSGWLLESGEVMLSVQDEGIGMAEDRLTRLNARLADFDPDSAYDQEGDDGLGLGLYVVARLAHRHGVRVQLREQKQSGVAAVVVLPAPILAEAPATAVPPRTVTSTTGTFSLPGATAEADANVLPTRPKDGAEQQDPLVALAEKAVRDAGVEPEREAASGQEPAAGEPGTSDAAEAAEEAGHESAGGPAEETTHEQAGPGPEETHARPKAPVETFAETTMELLLPLTDEPVGAPTDESAASASEASEASEASVTSAAPAAPAGPAARPSAEHTATEPQAPAAAEHTGHPRPEAEDDDGEAEERLTSKGLPKRTPKITAPAPPPRQRSTSVDAEALRRRLGGFRRGAQAGYRDVEAEIADHSEEATGGPVEEASS